MKPIHLITALATAAFIISPLSAQQSADASASSWVDPSIPKPDAEGWITLFDGAKLYGCSPDTIGKNAGKFGVSDGCLWLESGWVSFDVNARNVVCRAWVKKISGQNARISCRGGADRRYAAWFNGRGSNLGDFGLGVFRPKWEDLNLAKASRDFDDFVQMELMADGSTLTLKVEEKSVASIENDLINEAGAVSVATLKGRSLFKKIQVKILDGPPPPPLWTNTTGVAIQGDFIRLDGEILIIRKDEKKFRIPLAKLSLASREQARKLEAAMPGPAVAEPTVPANVPAAAESKQDDPEHQRKLAESILSKKGRIDVWRGSGLLTVTRLEALPKGKLSLKAISSVDGPFTDADAALLNGCLELSDLEIHRGTMTSLPLKSLSTLASVTLVDCKLNVSIFRGLRGNKNLINVNTSGVPLEAEIVEILASCPNLQNIKIERCGLEKVSLLPFKRLKLLTSLNVGGNALTGEELQGIAEIQTLDSLSFPNMDFSHETLGFLPKLRTTSSLNLINCKVSPEVLANAAAMPKLKRLELWNTDITDEMLVVLSGKKDLEYLGLEHTACTGEGFAKLGLLPKLIDLRLQGSKTRASDAGVLAIVQSCPSLKTLWLGGKSLSPAGLGHILNLKLKELRLYELAAPDNSFIASLSKKRELTALEISSSSISDGQVAMLEPMKSNLEILYLQNSRISDSCVETFKKMKLLKLLEISGTDISKEAVAGLRRSLPTCELRY